jgi:hypothetical protein
MTHRIAQQNVLQEVMQARKAKCVASLMLTEELSGLG